MMTTPAQSPKAVVLLSGGLDSSTCLATAQSLGFECYALSFDYGQHQRAELSSAQKQAEHFGVAQHRVLSIDLSGRSALTGEFEVPKARSIEDMSKDIPTTYVPARNTVFLAHALAWAEVLEAFDIFIGANALDYSGYPDCRPEFIEAFETMANLATTAAVEGRGRFVIQAPLLHFTKAQIVQKAHALKVPLQWTHTCYAPVIREGSDSAMACGQCDACLLRLQGFAQAGLRDPIDYAAPADEV